MSHQASAHVFKIRGLSHTERLALVCIADCHCPEHGVGLTIGDLAEFLEVDHREAAQILAGLEHQGVLAKVGELDLRIPSVLPAIGGSTT